MPLTCSNQNNQNIAAAAQGAGVPAQNPPIYTARQAMIDCGLDNANEYQGRTHAECIATDIFNDDFITCMDKTYDNLDLILNAFQS